MKIFIFSILISLIFIIKSEAQISHKGIPFSWQESVSEISLNATILKPVQIPKHSNIDKNSPFIFAELIEFNKSTDEVGQWINLDNGDRLWRLRLKSEGAYSLNFNFSRYLIPEGAEVYVYSPDRMNKLGAFTHKNNKEYGSLAIAPIPGDEIIIDYYEPEDVDFNGELTIGNIGHDYLNIFGEKDGRFGISGECNIDINCSEGTEWQIQKRSICRMFINGNVLCTGTLVNNTAQDQEPYILSANHCVNTQTLANGTVFIFNYESFYCRGFDGSVQQSISGADLVATKNNINGYLDFTLLRLSEEVPLDYKPYFAGWSSNNEIPEKTTCIHHPEGDVKKISHDFDASTISNGDPRWKYDSDSFWKINSWDIGTTEAGSSGSPIFDQNKHVVGTLTGGEASCLNTTGSDYFQMFSFSYDKYSADSMQLKHWLDPINSGVELINGLDTYNDDKEITNTTIIKHWGDEQELALYIANDGGYLAGNNIYQDKAKAEFFKKDEFENRNVITGAYVAFGYAKGRDAELIELQIIKDSEGTPSSILGSTSITLKLIKENADKDYVYYRFSPPIEINSSIYMSIVLPQYEGDTIALITTDTSENVFNTAWELNYYDEWLPYSNPDSWETNLSHLIALEIGNYTAIKDNIKIKQEINIYPNPATNEINIDLGIKSYKNISVDIYEPFGRLVLKKSYSPQNSRINLDISNLQIGFYLMAINIDGQITTKKFIKE